MKPALLGCMLLLILGCAQQPADPSSPAGLPPQTSTDASAGESAWVGPQWALVAIQSMNGEIYKPREVGLFTLRFIDGGRLQVRADCNRGRGSWQQQGRSGLLLGSVATTRMLCQPGSLDQRFLQQLSFVRSFVMRDGRLYLATLADGAILEFRPVAEVAQ